MLHITSAKKRGAIIGVYFLVFPVVSVIGPSAGGLMVNTLGYEYLFVAGISLIVLDMFLIRALKVTKELRSRIVMPELLRWLKVKLEGFPQIDVKLSGLGRGLTLSLFCEGVAEGVLWAFVPVMAFTLTQSELISGYAISLFALSGAVMTVFLGHLTDKIGRRALFVRVGALLTVIFTVALAGAKETASFIPLMSLVFLSQAMIPSFLFVMVGEKLEGEKKRGVVIREFMLDLGMLVGAGLMALLILLGVEMSYTVLISAAAFIPIALMKS